MINADLIAKKLGFLQEHFLRLQRRRPKILEEFLRDHDRQDLTALSFLVGVQEAMHIAAEESRGSLAPRRMHSLCWRATT